MNLADWIDSVQAKLNERLGHVAAGEDNTVEIAYWREGLTDRPVVTPRVMWDEEPDHEIKRALNGQLSGIGTWTDTLTIDCVADTITDCRALAVNVIQCMLLVSDPPALTFPIKGGTRMHDVAQHGRRARKISLQVGVSFAVPEDPMVLGSYEPIGPTEEAEVAGFESTTGGDDWSQP
jgi:hypothetical protein